MDHEEMKDQFTVSFGTYGDAIFRYVRLKVASSEVTEDITQETFTRYWQQLRLGKVIGNEKALLYRIAHNLVIDWYRKKKEQSLDVLAEAGFEFSEDSQVDAVHQAEFARTVAVMRELDAPTRDALLLRFVEGFSPKDIAEITGETPNTISVRLNRGIEKVKGRLHI